VNLTRNEILAAIGGCAFGVTGGVMLRLPLFPYVLPDAVINAISAAAGAAVAVIGAAWIAENRERKQKNELRLVLKSIGRPLNQALLEVIKMTGSKENHAHKRDLVRRKLRKLKTEDEAYGPRLEELRPLFQLVGPVSMFTFIRLNQVRGRVSKLITAMESADLTPDGIDTSLHKIRVMAERAQKRLVWIKENFDKVVLPDEAEAHEEEGRASER
jgi:hypothetical protein